jgi:hypothetical protein
MFENLERIRALALQHPVRLYFCQDKGSLLPFNQWPDFDPDPADPEISAMLIRSEADWNRSPISRMTVGTHDYTKNVVYIVSDGAPRFPTVYLNAAPPR